jgi:hypothetical protein
VAAVEEHHVGARGQALKGADRRAPQRGGQAGRVDLGGPGLADGEGLDPAPQLALDRGAARRAEPLGIGQPGWRIRETSPDDHRADRHRSGPGAATHLVHARDVARADGGQLALDLIPRPGRARGGPDRRGLVPERELFHSRHDGPPAAGRHGESPRVSANRRTPRA